MTQTGVGLGRWLLFWSIALGGAAFDLATKSMIFARVGEPPARLGLDHPRDPRAPDQSQPRRFVGFWRARCRTAA